MTDFKDEVREIINRAVEELFAAVADDFGHTDFAELVKRTKEAVDKLGSELVGKIVELTDELYNKRRDKHAIVIRNYKRRNLISELGELTLNRRLYYDKKAGKYFFAADEMLDIEKYSRIESGLKVKLISNAAQSSYGKACRLAANRVSAQSVSNILRRIPDASLTVQASGFKKVDALYIEADEDHIHLRNGKSAEVKLVYVYEGRRESSRNRVELVGAKYFASAGGSEIWLAVADYVALQYAVPYGNIRISGDGANWIKGGLEMFPGATYKIDKFHVYKSVTDACGGDRKFRKQVIESIKNDDRNAVLKLYTARWLGEQDNKSKRGRVADSLAYLDNNFDEIDLTSAYSCSAEGHVSHVLSDRMSSRPMAWSVKGADKMARLRAFFFNGGDFRSLAFAVKEDTEKNERRGNYPCRKTKGGGGAIPSGRIILSDEISEDVKRALKSIIFK